MTGFQYEKEFQKNKEIFNQRLGTRLKELFIVNNYTLDFISTYLCMSKSDVEKIETGEIAIPLYKLVKIAALLKIPEEKLIANLLCDEDEYEYATITLKISCIMKKLRFSDSYNDLKAVFKVVLSS